MAQIHFSYGWYHPDDNIQYLKTDLSQVHPQPLHTLLPRGLSRNPLDIETVSTTCWAWAKLCRHLKLTQLYSPLLPLADNPWLPPTMETLTKRTLTKFRLHTIGDLFVQSRCRTLTELTAATTATPLDRFVLHRLRTALLSTLPIPNQEPQELSTLSLLISATDNTHLISRIYHTIQKMRPLGGTLPRAAWETDLATAIPDDVWQYCCMQTRFVSTNYKHKLIHYKYLHRVYYTPVFLHKIRADIPDSCPKCALPAADFAHMTWTCTHICKFWGEVARVLISMIEQPLQLSPQLALMGYVKPLGRGIRRFTAIALLLAKRQISLHWGKSQLPTLRSWLYDLQYCSTASEDYASLLPISSRPRDVWQPLKSYLQRFPISDSDNSTDL